MDLPEAEAETNVDYTFLYFIYGFLALLGFCIIFSVGKAIYYYFKIRMTRNVASSEDCIHTECSLQSNEPSVSGREIENNAPDSDRLRDQLDKLRRLLNRLNAMGTFSRDTIGDLSAQTAPYVNNSITASSDLSAFWSSIDFDDFEESTINEGNFQTTPTEKSVSPSISDFSLDTSGILCGNILRKNIATSKESIRNTSVFNRQTNPSDAIVQILCILDSIMQKSMNNTVPLQSNVQNIERKFEKSTNIQALSRLTRSVESHLSQNRPNLSSSTVSMDKKISSRCESCNSDTLISTSGHLENLNTVPKVVDNALTSNPNLLDQLSHFIDSQYKVAPRVSVEAKIAKGMSVVNIMSSSGYNSLYTKHLATSSKLLDTKKIPVFRSAAIIIDTVQSPSIKDKRISESSLALSKEPYLLANGNGDERLPKSRGGEISSCTIDIQALNKSLSLSNILDNKSPAPLSIEVEKPSDEQKSELYNLDFEKKLLPVITISEPPQDCQQYFLNNEILVKESHNSNGTAFKIGNNNFSSLTSKSLHLPMSSYDSSIKSSISEPDMKHSSYLGMLSPNLSSSDSDAFLSPTALLDFSPLEKVDWKSPVEHISDTYVSNNLTPHNGNVVLSRKSCIWSTPPSPEGTITHEVDKKD